MMRKKYFGIGAVAILLLVAITPAVNSLNVKNIEEDGNDHLSFCSSNQVSVKIKKLEFVDYKLGRAHYLLEYTIGYNAFIEGIAKCKLMVDGNLIDSWEVELIHSPFPEFIDGTRTIKLISSENPSIDEERLLAGRLASLKVIHPAAPDEEYNIDYKIAKYWGDVDEYEPTKTQIEVTSPHSNWVEYTYWEEDIPLPSFTKLYNTEILPTLIRSNRMGWVGELSEHLNNMMEDLLRLLAANSAFLVAVSASVLVIVAWISDVIQFIKDKLVNSTESIITFKDLIWTFISIVVPALVIILAEKDLRNEAVEEAQERLLKHKEEFESWEASEPWNKPIKINVNILHTIPEEVITIRCRDVVKTIVASGSSEELTFYVTSESIEKDTAMPHNCQIFVSAEKHKDAQTIKALSYAFSNGTLKKTFRLVEKNRIVQNILQYFLNIVDILRSGFANDYSYLSRCKTID